MTRSYAPVVETLRAERAIIDELIAGFDKLTRTTEQRLATVALPTAAAHDAAPKMPRTKRVFSDEHRQHLRDAMKKRQKAQKTR